MGFPKTVLKKMAGTVFFRLFVRGIEMLPLRDFNILRVLTYHRVATESDRTDLDPGLISALPEDFERQIKWISQEFNPVSLADVIAAIAGDIDLPPRSLLMTFDDAYRDFGQNAWPILKRFGVPVALFVPTDFPGEPERSLWWDRFYRVVVENVQKSVLKTRFGTFALSDSSAKLDAFKKLKRLLKSISNEGLEQEIEAICGVCKEDPSPRCCLNWDELTELSRQGVDLVPHTSSHILLNRVSPEMAKDEILGSMQMLKDRMGSVLPAFAYPSGYYDLPTLKTLRAEGFALGFTTVRGCNDLNALDSLKLRRINVGRQTPDALIRLQMCPAAMKFQRPLGDVFPS